MTIDLGTMLINLFYLPSWLLYKLLAGDNPLNNMTVFFILANPVVAAVLWFPILGLLSRFRLPTRW